MKRKSIVPLRLTDFCVCRPSFTNVCVRSQCLHPSMQHFFVVVWMANWFLFISCIDNSLPWFKDYNGLWTLSEQKNFRKRYYLFFYWPLLLLNENLIVMWTSTFSRSLGLYAVATVRVCSFVHVRTGIIPDMPALRKKHSTNNIIILWRSYMDNSFARVLYFVCVCVVPVYRATCATVCKFIIIIIIIWYFGVKIVTSALPCAAMRQIYHTHLVWFRVFVRMAFSPGVHVTK